MVNLTYEIHASDDAAPFPQMIGQIGEVQIALSNLLDCEDIDDLFSLSLGGKFITVDGDFVALFGRLNGQAVHLMMDDASEQAYWAARA